MRAVPTERVPKEAVLAEDLYAPSGRKLLNKRSSLTPHLIEKIHENNIYTVYINDRHSQNQVEPIVERELRQSGIDLMKKVFTAVGNKDTAGRSKPRSIGPYLDELSKLTEDVLYEISSVKDHQLDYIDIKSLDDYLYASAFNVAILSVILGWELKLPNEHLRNLFVGGLFHDLGFTFLDRETLYKPEQLTREEKLEILKHPIHGHGYIKDQPFANAYVKVICLQHHEHLDGSGYPNRKALTPSDALEYLMGVAGRHYDQDLVNAFISKVNPYPEGSLVKLNTGQIAVVDQVHRQLPLRPVIRIIHEEADQVRYEKKNLQEDLNLVIESIHY